MFNLRFFLDNPLVIVPEKETSLAIMGKKLHSKVVHVFDSVTVSYYVT